MTKQQLELLQYIEVFIGINGYSPSFVEMQTALNLKSKSSVFRLLASLEEQGRIRRLRNRSRAIEVVKNPELPVDLSHLSTVQLAREAGRRYLVLCHRERDEFGTITYRPY